MVSMERGKGQGWEDVTHGGITLQVAEMSGKDVFHVEAEGVKGKDQGNSIL